MIEMPRNSLAQRQLARGDQVCDGDIRRVKIQPFKVGHREHSFSACTIHHPAYVSTVASLIDV